MCCVKGKANYHRESKYVKNTLPRSGSCVIRQMCVICVARLGTEKLGFRRAFRIRAIGDNRRRKEGRKEGRKHERKKERKNFPSNEFAHTSVASYTFQLVTP